MNKALLLLVAAITATGGLLLIGVVALLAIGPKELPRVLRSVPVCGDLALLVNNVGVGDEAPFMVHELKGRDVAEMIKVNCAATVNMSRAVLPLLKERRRGAVINVSSGSSAQPTPCTMPWKRASG